MTSHPLPFPLLHTHPPFSSCHLHPFPHTSQHFNPLPPAHTYKLNFVPYSRPWPSPLPLISPLHLVTMQIYLNPITRRTGSSEAAKSAPTVPNSRPTRTPTPPQTKGGPPTSDRTKRETCKTPPAFTLPLQKSTNQNTYSPLDTFNYKSPLKSPSQYFQICY